MWYRTVILSGFLCVLATVMVSGQGMDNVTLYKILDSVTESLEGSEGMWQIEYSDRTMLVITDEKHDRMRIITPVDLVDEVTPDQMENAMIANFHSVLDVRYAVSDDILWAAFLHPLTSVSEDEVRDALLQVYRAAETFGSTYSSTELIFPGSSGSEEKKKEGKKKM